MCDEIIRRCFLSLPENKKHCYDKLGESDQVKRALKVCKILDVGKHFLNNFR